MPRLAREVVLYRVVLGESAACGDTIACLKHNYTTESLGLADSPLLAYLSLPTTCEVVSRCSRRMLGQLQWSICKRSLNFGWRLPVRSLLGKYDGALRVQ